MRYGKKDAANALKRLASMCGRSSETYKQGEDGRYHAQIGAVGMDYNPIYGGCVPHTVYNAGGGLSMPFGEYRMTAREFCRAVRLVEGVLRVREENRFKNPCPAE